MHDSERDRIFGEWLTGHKGILFKVVHAYAFEHADRQDLFQEITIQVWRSVDAFRGDSSVPTWMYRVALNTAIAWMRKEGRHQRGKQELEVVKNLLTTASANARDPRLEWLYHQIAQLKDVDRSVALLLLDGFSYKEIASIVGITESNLGVKINRIKSALAGKRVYPSSLKDFSLSRERARRRAIGDQRVDPFHWRVISRCVSLSGYCGRVCARQT